MGPRIQRGHERRLRKLKTASQDAHDSYHSSVLPDTNRSLLFQGSFLLLFR
jgi:hypothetical protein